MLFRFVSFRFASFQITSKSDIAEVVHVDLYRCEEQISQLAARKDSYVQRAIAAGDTRFFVVTTFSVRAPLPPRIRRVCVGSPS